MVQKIFALLILQAMILCSSWTILITNASFEWVNTQILVEKAKLEKIKNGLTYRKKIDSLVSKLNDSNKIVELQEKIDEKMITIYYSKWEEHDLYILLRYLSVKIENKKEYLEKMNLEKFLNEVNTPNVTPDNVKKVENEVVKLQNLLLKKEKELFDLAEKNLNSSFQQSWNFSLSINWSLDTFWKAEGGVNISNIDAKQVNLDGQVSAELSASWKLNIQWNDAFDVQISSLINFVKKDDSIYILLDKLNYSWITKEKILSFLEKLKESASNNQYIQFDSETYPQNTQITELLNYKNINSELADFLWWNVSLFTPYKKVWNTYYLIPKREACNKFASMYNSLYSYANIECSDKVYNELLKGFSRYSIYIILEGAQNTLWFKEGKNEITLKYSNETIKSILINIKEKWNVLYISYDSTTWTLLNYNDWSIEAKYAISKWKITWSINIWNENSVKISTTWSYSKWYLEVKNTIDLWFLKNYISSNNEKTTKNMWNLDFMIKHTENTDIFSMDLWIEVNSNYLYVHLKSDSTKDSYNWEIKAPSNFIPIDLLEESGEEDFPIYDF